MNPRLDLSGNRSIVIDDKGSDDSNQSDEGSNQDTPWAGISTESNTGGNESENDRSNQESTNKSNNNGTPVQSDGSSFNTNADNTNSNIGQTQSASEPNASEPNGSGSNSDPQSNE
jgi:hypothetical protein